MSESAPWSAFEQARIDIPPPLTEWLRGLAPDAFSAVVRSGLYLDAAEDKRPWLRLWQTLALAPDLARLTSRVLEDWERTAGEHLAVHPDDKEAAAFVRQCRNATNRLAKIQVPITAGGKDSLTGRLLKAIADHEATIIRDGTPAYDEDVTLWERGRYLASRTEMARRRDAR